MAQSPCRHVGSTSPWLLLGAYVARRVYKWRIKILEEKGIETHAMAWALAVFATFMIAGWLVHPVMGVLGYLWAALAWMFGNVPVIVFQLVTGRPGGLAGLPLHQELPRRAADSCRPGQAHRR